MMCPFNAGSPALHCTVSSSELLTSGCKMTLSHSTVSPAPQFLVVQEEEWLQGETLFDTLRVPPASFPPLWVLSLRLSTTGLFEQLMLTVSKLCWCSGWGLWQGVAGE